MDILQPGDMLVVNNTRVIPARLLARRPTGGTVELLLLKPETGRPGLWQALANPLRKLKPGDRLPVQVQPQGGAAAEIVVEEIIVAPDGQKRALVNLGSQTTTYELLAAIGNAPLPPYIDRREHEAKLDQAASTRARDLERYQTIFAQSPGAVAAPTAGLHFSPDVVSRLADKGVALEQITLHVGPGTFKPITSTLAEHSIEAEEFSVSGETARNINAAKEAGRRVIAVGTTTCRALETAGATGSVQAVENGASTLYIQPGFTFRILDGLITNFHLSRSSLLVLVSAFGGYDLVKQAYREAVSQQYRFFSYGDAMLIL